MCIFMSFYSLFPAYELVAVIIWLGIQHTVTDAFLRL